MNKARKEWVEALRSGKYKQGTGTLHTKLPDDSEEFCCLGVACDLFYPKCDVIKVENENSDMVSYDGQGGTLPIAIAKHLGFETTGNRFQNLIVKIESGIYKGSSVGITILNDNGMTFGQLAQIIENDLVVPEDLIESVIEIINKSGPQDDFELNKTFEL